MRICRERVGKRMNEVKAMTVLMGADGDQVERFINAVLDLAVEQGMSMGDLAVALGSISILAEDEIRKCETAEEFRERFRLSGYVGF